MARVFKIIGILGLVICIFIMYFTDHGIRGIQKFSPSFRLLDMRFHYSSETVSQTFNQIGEGGRAAYQKLLVLDFFFILFLLITMITISSAVPLSLQSKSILYIVCGLRALFDILENILLLNMLGQYPVFNQTIAKMCSWITTLKFSMLFIWLIVIAFQASMLGINLIKRDK